MFASVIFLFHNTSMEVTKLVNNNQMEIVATTVKTVVKTTVNALPLICFLVSFSCNIKKCTASHLGI